MNLHKDLPNVPSRTSVVIEPLNSLGFSYPGRTPQLDTKDRMLDKRRPIHNVAGVFAEPNTGWGALTLSNIDRDKTQNRSELSLAEANAVQVYISSVGSNKSLVSKEIQKTPTKLPRRPPAPIRIPNGRIHAPAIVVERDPDLADLETRISTSMKNPRLQKKSIKRTRLRGHLPEQTSERLSLSRNSTRNSRLASASTDRDGSLTEDSNDDLRFSLEFLLQPERTSVMTNRTCRADSATLPELSPFLASDSYIPPVPSIPPSLRHTNANTRSDNPSSVHHAGSNKRCTMPSPSRSTSESPKPRASPLASACSQLPAISTSCLTRTSVSRQFQGSHISEVLTEYSPAFTAASPLESPDKAPIPMRANLTDSFAVGVESPTIESQGSGNPNVAPVSNRRPGTLSPASIPTPELSPSRKGKEFLNGPSSSTPESLTHSSSSQGDAPNNSGGVQSQISKQYSVFPSRLHPRELPKSAVPRSAISPSASTASLDKYTDAVILDNKPDTTLVGDLNGLVDLSMPAKCNFSVPREAMPSDSTFAPNHTDAGPDSKAKQDPRSRELQSIPLDRPSIGDTPLPGIGQRRPSLPSPVNIVPAVHERRPSAPSPLSGGTILFTPSSHQSLQAALGNYSSSGSTSISSKTAGRVIRAIDDTSTRNSNLSVRTDHIRTAPRPGLVPYTPFSQGSDFTPATTSTRAHSAKANASVKPLAGALSAPSSIKLATGTRMRPPSGPRKPRGSVTKPGEYITTIPERECSHLRERSRVGTASQLVLPSTPSFEAQPVQFKGLTLDVAKWTFTQGEMQELTRRAVCQSADPLSIRLLPSQILNSDIPEEIERLELQREELKANYKYQHKCRISALSLLATLAEATEPGLNLASLIKRISEELRDIGTKSDRYAEDLYKVCDQITQLRALQDGHSASALAVALRKINSAFIKVSAEAADLKRRLSAVTMEKEDAWAIADGLEREMNLVKAELEQERGPKKLLPPPPPKRARKGKNGAFEAPEEISRPVGRVLAARRRSEAILQPRYSATSPQPISALSSNSSTRYSFYEALASSNPVPPLPLNHSARLAHLTDTGCSPLAFQQLNSAQSNLRSQRSGSFSGTPSTSSQALIHAQNELLQVLGVPVRGITEQGFRRTRSFSDADVRASIIPPTPPATTGKQSNTSTFNHRESRITSLYGAYLSHHSIVIDGRMEKRSQTRASQWDMEAIYDGILDDPDALFAVVRPEL